MVMIVNEMNVIKRLFDAQGNLLYQPSLPLKIGVGEMQENKNGSKIKRLFARLYTLDLGPIFKACS